MPDVKTPTLTAPTVAAVEPTPLDTWLASVQPDVDAFTMTRPAPDASSVLFVGARQGERPIIGWLTPTEAEEHVVSVLGELRGHRHCRRLKTSPGSGNCWLLTMYGDEIAIGLGSPNPEPLAG